MSGLQVRRLGGWALLANAVIGVVLALTGLLSPPVPPPLSSSSGWSS